jgi:hypothetical protein
MEGTGDGVGERRATHHRRPADLPRICAGSRGGCRGAEWSPAALLASSSWEGAPEKDGIAVLVSWRGQGSGSRGRDKVEGRALPRPVADGRPAACHRSARGGIAVLVPWREQGSGSGEPAKKERGARCRGPSRMAGLPPAADQYGWEAA